MNQQLTQQEVSLDLMVDVLVAIADPARQDDAQLNCIREGFVDAMKEQASQALPGTIPEYYATGHRFGRELLELVRWTHEIQADGKVV